MFLPPKRTLPLSGLSIPEMMLKSVVFPAPLGPISPRISPSAKEKLTSLSTTSPEKLLEMCEISRIGSVSLRLLSSNTTRLEEPPRRPYDSLGHRHDHPDYHHAQDYQVQKRIPPVEVVPDPIEERSTYYRPHNRPQPSKHHHRDRVQRHPHVEGVRRVDECNLPDRERPRQPCKETTYDESDRLVEGRVHSDRTRGLLLLSYRLHCDTELRPRHEVHCRDAEGSHYGHHVEDDVAEVDIPRETSEHVEALRENYPVQDDEGKRGACRVIRRDIEKDRRRDRKSEGSEALWVRLQSGFKPAIPDGLTISTTTSTMKPIAGVTAAFR